MKNILEELWYGNIIPMEHSVGGNAHIKNLINLMSKNREKLSETLNDSQKELLARYDDAVNEMYAEIEKNAFIYGFRLGGKIVSDIFRNDV
ncbi:MAG: hypothetical protein J6A05_06145 [Oscillospiraceae bacterium]|nr:hypothetical protein [Oscillospiraceae bacterium]